MPDESAPTSRVMAYAMLAQHALSSLWADSDFQPNGMGCCHVCCARCAALLYLDRSGVLDLVLREWPEGMAGSDMFVDNRVDRSWMYRQWSYSPVQQQCGHRLGLSEGGHCFFCSARIESTEEEVVDSWGDDAKVTETVQLTVRPCGHVQGDELRERFPGPPLGVVEGGHHA